MSQSRYVNIACQWTFELWTMKPINLPHFYISKHLGTFCEHSSTLHLAVVSCIIVICSNGLDEQLYQSRVVALLINALSA